MIALVIVGALILVAIPIVAMVVALGRASEVLEDALVYIEVEDE